MSFAGIAMFRVHAYTAPIHISLLLSILSPVSRTLRRSALIGKTTKESSRKPPFLFQPLLGKRVTSPAGVRLFRKHSILPAAPELICGPVALAGPVAEVQFSKREAVIPRYILLSFSVCGYARIRNQAPWHKVGLHMPPRMWGHAHIIPHPTMCATPQWALKNRYLGRYPVRS